jgi:hypothetical protein
MVKRTLHNITAAELFVKIRSAQGEMRMWQARDGVAFFWVDPAGNSVAGYETRSRTGSVDLVVYPVGRDSMANPPARRHVMRPSHCEDCGKPGCPNVSFDPEWPTCPATWPACPCDNSADPAHTEGCECTCHAAA